MDKAEIEKLLELSKIDLPEEETETLTNEMKEILEYVSDIAKVAGDKVEPSVPEHRNVMRDDSDPHAPGKYTDALLKEAPESEDGYVKVKKIL